jgi:thiamine pyrophosphokinase
MYNINILYAINDLAYYHQTCINANTDLCQNCQSHIYTEVIHTQKKISCIHKYLKSQKLLT